MMYKMILFISLAGTLILSCKKETAAPALPPEDEVDMLYTSLDNREVKYQQRSITLDVNNDQRADLFFGVQLVGDHINAVDKRQYFIGSALHTSLPVNVREQIPPLNEGDIIPVGHFNGNTWYGASEIVLMELNEYANGSILWKGNWLDLGKKYLPFQILQNGRRYNGWIELTADKGGERLILHRLAISKESEKEVRAGR